MIEESTYYHDIGLSTGHGCPGVMPESHRHMEIEINFLERGSVTYLLANGLQVISEGRLAAFWGAFPHRIVETSGDPSFFLFYIPFSRFLAWSLPGNLTGILLNGGVAIEIDETNASEDRIVFPRWHHVVLNPDPDSTRTLYLEIEARMRRLAQNAERFISLNDNVPAAETGRKHEPELVKVQQMIAVIAERYADALSVVEVAGAVGLHPKYAMSIFSRAMGITILTYIKQHRMSHAQRLLATTDAKIVTIACSSGFGSVSRFYEVFHEVCGESPNDYRQRIVEKLNNHARRS